MAGKRNNNNRNIKHCPLIDAECLQSRCMLYYEDFDQCGLNLMNYNAYKLAIALRKCKDDKD